jgi:hypothetical protein
MSRKPVAIRPGDVLSHAAQMMLAHKVRIDLDCMHSQSAVQHLVIVV